MNDKPLRINIKTLAPGTRRTTGQTTSSCWQAGNWKLILPKLDSGHVYLFVNSSKVNRRKVDVNLLTNVNRRLKKINRPFWNPLLWSRYATGYLGNYFLTLAPDDLQPLFGPSKCGPDIYIYIYIYMNRSLSRRCLAPRFQPFPW